MVLNVTIAVCEVSEREVLVRSTLDQLQLVLLIETNIVHHRIMIAKDI
jgi:hypothetical protein